MNKLASGIYAIAMVMIFAIGPAISQDQTGLIQIDTQISYQDMIKKLNAAVKKEGMHVVTRASASAGAKNRGIITKGNMVVGVYRNDFALRMLEASVAAGIEAPIRFYITERRDGSAKLSYKTPSAVFAPYMANAEPELKDVANELDIVFAAIANSATNEN